MWGSYSLPASVVSTFLTKMALLVIPGSMIATRIPNPATSCANSSLAPSRAHFDAVYGAWAIAAKRPTTEVMLTMVPRRRSRIPGNTALRQRSAPKKLTFMTSR